MPRPSPEELAETTPAEVPGDLAAEWRARQALALRVIDEALTAGDGRDPAWHKVRLMAADRVLGFRRGALPLPRLGEAEYTDGQRVLRLRWASGRAVVMPVRRSAMPEADPDRGQ